MWIVAHTNQPKPPIVGVDQTIRTACNESLAFVTLVVKIACGLMSNRFCPRFASFLPYQVLTWTWWLVIVVVIGIVIIWFSLWNSCTRRVHYGHPPKTIRNIIVLIYIFICVFINAASSTIFLNSSTLKFLLLLGLNYIKHASYNRIELEEGEIKIENVNSANKSDKLFKKINITDQRNAKPFGHLFISWG